MANFNSQPLDWLNFTKDKVMFNFKASSNVCLTDLLKLLVAGGNEISSSLAWVRVKIVWPHVSKGSNFKFHNWKSRVGARESAEIGLDR